MTWTWQFGKADGTVIPSSEIEIATTEAFPGQGDAESWLGEVWRELAAAGIDTATLREGDRTVYGPMSLHPDS